MRQARTPIMLTLGAALLGCGSGTEPPKRDSTIGGPPTAAAVVLAAGDISTCGFVGPQVTAAILDGQPEGTVLALGDEAYESGTAAEFACYDATWGRHKSRTRPTPGNHEYAQFPDAAPYFDYFGAAAGADRRGWYSFDAGAWHLLSLNGNADVSASSAQLQWVRQDVAAHPTRCALAYWHQPRFSSGLEHGSDAAFAPLWRLLDSLGVDVVLAGHDHDYERFAPQRADGTPAADGIREFVVGTGGRQEEPFGTRQPSSEAMQNTSWGVLKLTLRDSTYDWQFLADPAHPYSDAGTGSCGG